MSITVDLSSKLQRPYAGTGMSSFFVMAPNGLSYHSIRYGDGVWLAVAVNGLANQQVVKSVDGGFTWTAKTVPGVRQWTGLAYCGLKRWVAVAQNGAVAGQAMYSTDHGETWNSATTPVSIGWQSVAYGNGICIAVANTGLIGEQVMRSTDFGATWWLSAGGAAALRQWNAVCFANGRFIAVAYDGGGDQTMYSTDLGQNWVGVAEAATMQWDGVCYDGKSRVVAVAFQSVPNNVMYSDNLGTSWKQGSLLGITSDWAEVAYGNNCWCAVAGNIGRLGYSPDGIAFRNQPFVDNTAMYAIDYGQGRFISCGNLYFQIS
jgi:hypothetical protein